MAICRAVSPNTVVKSNIKVWLAAWDRLSSLSLEFYILQVCHPERRLPESKDLAAAVFAAVICPGAT